jgi:protein-S-isoprenylcysteine O-methyltransferase Ste14
MDYDYGLWPAVIFSILFFGLFLLTFVRPRLKREWRAMGIFSAFLVALFTEMYGFPLTIYLLVTYFGDKITLVNPFGHLSGNLWASLFLGQAWSLPLMAIGAGLQIIALVLLGSAWRQIYRAQGKLITQGLYGIVRHPQYASLILLIIGSLINWPTPITLFMAPLLVFKYYRLAKKEETELEAKVGIEYQNYKERTPAFIPRLTGLFSSRGLTDEGG